MYQLNAFLQLDHQGSLPVKYYFRPLFIVMVGMSITVVTVDSRNGWASPGDPLIWLLNISVINIKYNFSYAIFRILMHSSANSNLVMTMVGMIFILCKEVVGQDSEEVTESFLHSMDFRVRYWGVVAFILPTFSHYIEISRYRALLSISNTYQAWTSTDINYIKSIWYKFIIVSCPKSRVQNEMKILYIQR